MIWIAVDEDEIGDHLGQKERGGRRRGHALRIQHLVAKFARPRLVQRGDGSEQGSHTEDSTGNLPRNRLRRIEGQAEEHDHQQREEEHGVDRVFGSPLDTQVLGEVNQQIGPASRTGRFFAEVGEGRPGRAEIVRGREQNLRAALPGRNRDQVETLDRLVHVGGKFLPRPNTVTPPRM